MLNAKVVKKDFKIFENRPDLIYLDSASSSLTPDCVVEAMNDYYYNYRSNVSRGSSFLGNITTVKFNESRQKIADFFQAKFNEVIFTKSTTQGLNDIARSLSEFINEGDEIIVTNLEHHANFLPWLEVAKKKGAKLKFVKYHAENSTIMLEDIQKLVTNKTKVIAIHHVSNVLGNKVNIEEICNYANEKKIYTVIDGAQGAPHTKVNFSKINCDFYTISAHKLLGPTGLGIILMKEEIAKKISPFLYGGEMVAPSSVDYDDFLLKDSPYKFEAGTQPIAEVIGCAKAVEYLENLGIENVEQHSNELKKYAEKLLEDKNYVEVYNNNLESSILLFNIKGIPVHDVVSPSMLNDVTFSSAQIVVRDGQHCNNLAMRYIVGKTATIRASFYLYNTKEDVEILVEQIENVFNATKEINKNFN